MSIFVTITETLKEQILLRFLIPSLGQKDFLLP